MRNFKIAAAVVIAGGISLLSGCTTPYQAQGLMGGYKDMALNKDTYFVEFRGNGMTTATTVQNYTLRRAAELTISHGYKYFILINAGTNVKNQLISTPTTIQTQSNGSYMGTAYGNGYGYSTSGFGNSHSYTTINPGARYNISKYHTHIVIKMLHSNKNYPKALDANIILSNFQKN